MRCAGTRQSGWQVVLAAARWPAEVRAADDRQPLAQRDWRETGTAAGPGMPSPVHSAVDPAYPVDLVPQGLPFNLGSWFGVCVLPGLRV